MVAKIDRLRLLDMGEFGQWGGSIMATMTIYTDQIIPPSSVV